MLVIAPEVRIVHQGRDMLSHDLRILFPGRAAKRLINSKQDCNGRKDQIRCSGIFPCFAG